MFRNNRQGNRDLYITQSLNGNNFSEAIKIGEGNWKLNACPMDGGKLHVDDKGTVQTVWRRVDKIFSCVKGDSEIVVGKGKNCTMEKVGENYVYAWTDNQHVICVLPGNKKIDLGSGNFPVLEAVDSKQVICVWQFDNNIYSKIIHI
jgi:hypothetical protein